MKPGSAATFRMCTPIETMLDALVVMSFHLIREHRGGRLLISDWLARA
jgi:hypothetical protein